MELIETVGGVLSTLNEVDGLAVAVDAIDATLEQAPDKTFKANVPFPVSPPTVTVRVDPLPVTVRVPVGPLLVGNAVNDVYVDPSDALLWMLLQFELNVRV